MREDFRELWKYRELLAMLVQRDLRIRYKNSVLGFWWSLLNPLVQVLTLTVVLQLVLQVKIPNYHAYVFCATLPWLYFSSGVMDSSVSLVYFHHLIRRAYFPRELIPLASVLSNLIHFGLATGVFLVYITANALFWWTVNGRLDWPLLPTALLLPLPMAGLALLVTGVALFISVWTLYFEDMRYIADSGLKILNWLVPVIWFTEMLEARCAILYSLCLLNPLAMYITAFRKLTLVPTVIPGLGPTRPMGAPEWGFLLLALLVSAGVALAGFRFFSRRKWKLAERA
jgi:lipopolysaccharide transport system permease protein